MNKKKKVIIIFVITSLILTVALFLLLFLKDHHQIWKEITVPIYENGKQVSTGTIPLPPNTRHYNEGMNLDYFITEGDAEDIKNFLMIMFQTCLVQEKLVQVKDTRVFMIKNSG